jgi:hypothetical protein
MDITGKTSIIDSDFRAGAIFFSLTNALLFSFAVTNTVIYGRLVAKNNKLDGVNVLVMSIISGILSILAGALVVYSIYKLVMVREKRDKIERDLQQTTMGQEMGNMRTLTIDQPEFKSVRDLNKGITETSFSNIKPGNYRPAIGSLPRKGIF